MSFSVTRDGDTYVLHGELDMAGAPDLERLLSSVTAEDDVTLDLRDLRFVDSSGLNVFFRTAKKAGSVVLLDPAESVKRLLELVRANDIDGLEVRSNGGE